MTLQPKLTYKNNPTVSGPPHFSEILNIINMSYYLESATYTGKERENKGSEPMLLWISKLNSVELLQFVPHEGPAQIFSVWESMVL